jgi:hypothetical protein
MPGSSSPTGVVDYILGLSINAVLRADPELVTATDICAAKQAVSQDPALRNRAERRCGAKSRKCRRRVVAARIEASTLGMDIR